MSYIIDLKLNQNFNGYIYENTKQIDKIELLKLNIAVGSNNSGKSRFLRQILKEKVYSFKIKDNNLIDEINDFIKNNKNFYEQIKQKNELNNLTDVSKKEALEGLSELYENRINEIDYISDSIPINDYAQIINISKTLNLTYKISYDYNKYKNQLDLIQKEFNKLKKPFNKIYIPTLRSLRNLDYLDNAKREINKCLTESRLERDVTFDNDFFKGRTLYDYWFQGEKDIQIVNIDRQKKFTYSAYEDRISVKIITGLSFYDDITDMLLGEPEERKLVSDWEFFLQKHFFEDQQISITPNRKENIIKVKINNEERPIYELGDGLQTILIITFSLFKYKKNKTLLLIEEPELYLHPSYQRKLMEIMMEDQFNNMQYFITTHSNHFLDLTMDFPDEIMIYHFDKISDNKFNIIKKTDENTKYILKSIGVKPSSLFLSNCIILVEGISDIIYFKKYIQLFIRDKKKKNYIYEKHYCFLEYSGNNIEHWSFLNGEINDSVINPNIFIVADNDDQLTEEDFNLIETNEMDKIEVEEGSKKERLIKLLKLKKKSFVLKVRESENLIKGSILRNTIINKEKKYNQTAGNEREIDAELIPDFNEKDYKIKPLGKYLDNEMNNFKQKDGGYIYSLSKSSGTIKDKIDFANLVIENLNSFEDLTKEAQELTEILYNFIDSNNLYSA